MIPAGTKVYFAAQPTDMRKSFDGLAALAASALAKNPAEGGLFVFINRRCTQARILFRDRHGWCLLSKRLDEGHFRKPQLQEGRFYWEAETQALMRFLDDVDLNPRRRKRQASPRAPSLQIVST
jgi:transposase